MGMSASTLRATSALQREPSPATTNPSNAFVQKAVVGSVRSALAPARRLQDRADNRKCAGLWGELNGRYMKSRYG